MTFDVAGTAQAGAIANLDASGTLSGGQRVNFAVETGATLVDLNNFGAPAAAITTLQTNLALGAGSKFEVAVGGTLVDVTSSLTTVSGSPILTNTLTLTGHNSAFAHTLNVVSNGFISLSNDALQAAGLSIDASSIVGGYGSIAVAAPFINNNGQLWSQSFGPTSLLIVNDVAGSGAIRLFDGSTLEFARGVAGSQTINFDASETGEKLIIDAADAAGFDATLHGFDTLDTIDLAHTVASGASLDSTDLLSLVDATGATVATLQLAGDYTGKAFVVSGDGGAGTKINVVTAKTWTGSVAADPGNWNNAGNWSSNSAPAAGDAVMIPATGPQPTIPGDASGVLGGPVTNNGTITLAANANLFIDAPTSLQGGGFVTLSANSAAGVSQMTTHTAGAVLVNMDNTIQGAGEINAGTGLALVNQVDGTIDANVNGQQLVLDVSHLTNNGSLFAENGGTLVVNVDATHLFDNLTADPGHPGGSVLTGGSYDVVDAAAGGTSHIAFAGAGALPITTLDARVNLTGASSTFLSGGATLQSSLRHIAAGGDLELFSSPNSGTSPNLIDPNALTIDGQLRAWHRQLHGGLDHH